MRMHVAEFDRVIGRGKLETPPDASDGPGTPSTHGGRASAEYTPTTFTVFGRPVTKGSTKFIPHRTTGKMVAIPMNERLRSWTRDCRAVAVAMKPRMIHKPQPVKVTAAFVFKAPKKPRASMPTVRPDLDKTLRALLDALTSVCFADDSQVVCIETSKAYGPEDKTIVTVERLR